MEEAGFVLFFSFLSISSQLLLLFAYIWQARGFQNSSLWKEKQKKKQKYKLRLLLCFSYHKSLNINKKAAIQDQLEMTPLPVLQK